jgi:rhodanese-related sulfurtransferase
VQPIKTGSVPAGRLPGLNVGRYSISTGNAEIARSSWPTVIVTNGGIRKTKIIVTVCPHYDRAEIARTFLTLRGYRSKYLVEGVVGLAEYLRGDKIKDFLKEIKK